MKFYECPVLDHGFVRLRNLAGPTRRTTDSIKVDTVSRPEFHFDSRPFDADDVDVANAARLSFDGMDQDRTYDMEMKLNRYLLQNQHMTPFEVIVLWLEFQMPIFVARQLVRQRTQSINEVSGRYVQLPDKWYIPEVVGGKAANKKQGQEDNLDPDVQARFKFALNRQCEISYRTYEAFLAEGVAPEHARMFLHLNHYTHWMTTMNLRNLLISFLSLRDHSHAQIEAQAYAKAVCRLIEPHLPGIMSLYYELVRK